MTLVGLSVRTFERIRREHALLLAGACVTILLFNLPVQRLSFGSLRLVAGDSTRDEAAIDAALQDAANAALQNRDGTIIVMDPRTGRVRATVNRTAAYSQAFMPGSAIKPFTTLAALRAGLIDEDSRTACPGRFTGLNFSLACVHGDHLPPFNPSQAIAYSCNYYFATLGQRLGRDKLIATLREFDFGQPTGIADAEAAGVVRPCEGGSSARVESNHAVEPDCYARTAVGESENLQVTPIQLLAAYAALVNGGHLYEPRITDANNFDPTERSRINISAQQRAIITEGMAGAVRYGTARAAKLDALPITIIGKTGTANPPKGFRTNGWFIGFAAPFASNDELDPAKIEVAVLVLLPRAHGSQAAELARPIFAAYANASQQPDRESGQRSSPSSADTSSSRTDRSARGNPQAASVRVHLVHDNVTQELSLEDYVLGVMRAEGTLETAPEALKALAIAIRTYGVKNAGRHAKDGYDFCSTTHCQRFVKTSTAPDPRLVAAVRVTQGKLLVDDHGDAIDSYFGASCGGETANIGDLWGVTPPQYLRGGRDEYCESGPHSNWTDTISRADLLRAVQSDSRTDVGSHLDNVFISKRDDSGRAEFMRLVGEHEKTIRGWDFKIIVGRVLGWNVLKSSRFEVGRAGSNFVFRGTGFGHGLGLCQEGAHVMAARGASYEKILEKYFPGTNVKTGVETRRQNDTRSFNREAGWKSDVLAYAHVSASRPLPNSAARMLSISSDHFRLTYPADVDRRDANQVLNTLESARADYLRRASSAVSVNIPSLEIRLNESTGDFTSRTGQPWWAAAATKGRSIELQPWRLLKQRGVLFTTLRHELAHVVIDAVGHDRAAHWLSEGFAIYLAGEGETYSKGARILLSPEKLEDRITHAKSQTEMRALYAAAYIKVTEILRDSGEASIWQKLNMP